MKRVNLLNIFFVLCLNSFSFGQNNPPVAVGESFNPELDTVFQSDTTFVINVLINDFDPDGDKIEIFEVKNRFGQESIIEEFSDSSITIILDPEVYEMGFDYRLREVGDTLSISNWATLIINPCFYPNLPIARNDTVIGMRGQLLMVDVLQNDFHPLNDTIFLISGGMGTVVNNQIEIECPFYVNENFYRILYTISDKITIPSQSHRRDRGIIYVKLLNSEFYDSLNVNNINARFYCFGNHFWDQHEFPKFEVPKGSNSNSMFTQTFWIGGLDENNELHQAGELYRELFEYWSGPVADVYDSLYDSKWLHVWKLNRDEINYHKAHWWQTGYEPVSDILTWPGNGDTNLGQAEKIAPFEDNNNNGVYEPLEGDVPVIKGDQALYFVVNESRKVHEASGGIPMGVEIRGMAYGFDMPEDSVLWSTIFLNYEVVNRSDTAYHDVYAGFYIDPDLGYPHNDYIQCDVQRGMVATYNGHENDTGAYYYNQPAIGVVVLGGPFMEADGVDNPKYDVHGNRICDESINGLNFGDSVVDNERLGMTNFLRLIHDQGIQGYPDAPNEYYNYLKSIWRDNVHSQYGGAGHPVSNSVGPACRFMFPGDSDTCNWGTEGIFPNGGYNQNGKYWTEEEAGIPAFEKSGVLSSGPFTFAPGEVHQFDIAYVWARAYDGNPWSSVVLLKERVDYIREMFEYNENFFSDISKKIKPDGLKLWPNPAGKVIHVQLPENTPLAEWTVYNLQGLEIMEQYQIPENRTISINIAQLNSGLYFLRINNGSIQYSARFIKP